MRARTLKQRLEQDFAKAPDIYYFPDAMPRNKMYYGYRRDNKLDDFLIDDITWNDLGMDNVFKRINACESSSGEQYLYYMLRSPAVSEDGYNERAEAIETMEKDPGLRLKLQVIFAKLGRNRYADVSQSFSPSKRSPKMLIVYLALAVSLIASALSLIFTMAAVPFLIGLFVFNSLLHAHMSQKMKVELATVNYSVGMIVAAKRIEKLKSPKLQEMLEPMYAALGRLKAVLKVGGVTTSDSDQLVGFVVSVLLLDLISFEYLKNKLGRHHEDMFKLHEYLGMTDAAISVASYRKSISGYVLPELNFSAAKDSYFIGKDMRHPLISSPVPNSIELSGSALVTGSNASGKSTFLKTAALNAVLAQSICTALCSQYRGSAFRIFSSMALTDNLLAGESYYITEIKSLKRIIDRAEKGERIICFVDEVLRGTNTIERIAASCEILAGFGKMDMVCIAATHDIELCALLADKFVQYHFEEHITDEGMLFDYKLRDGAAASRNAIKLLGIMGFDEKLVERADMRAEEYMKSGHWLS